MKRLITFILFLVCGCAANKPLPITPPPIKISGTPQTISAVNKTLPAPNQVLLGVSCSNVVMIPNEYTVYVTNSNWQAPPPWNPAVVTNVATYEVVFIPVSGNYIFVKARNQIGK
jgi:hypothetical protein